jgi:hypothetical protein
MPKTGCSEVKDDDARNAGGEGGDVKMGFVGRQSAEDRENAKTDCPVQT